MKLKASIAMKLKVSILIGILFALSGNTLFAQETNDYYNSSKTQKKTSTASKTKTYFKRNTETTSVPVVKTQAATDNRAAAVRMLASGDEETRKARLESLQRLGKAAKNKNA